MCIRDRNSAQPPRATHGPPTRHPTRHPRATHAPPTGNPTGHPPWAARRRAPGRPSAARAARSAPWPRSRPPARPRGRA
eukprot:4137062-Prymnesium_polylepis.1